MLRNLDWRVPSLPAVSGVAGCPAWGKWTTAPAALADLTTHKLHVAVAVAGADLAVAPMYGVIRRVPPRGSPI